MENLGIEYPSNQHRNYVDNMYEFSRRNGLSLILKGSLSKNTATKFSDIDLIILGDISNDKLDELITSYGMPVMMNFTENPKGILILVYQDNISVDLDFRDIVSQEDLKDSKILLKNNNNFIVTDNVVKRKNIESKYIVDRPEWYKTLKLIHKGMIKYLSNKKENAYVFLGEISEALKSLEIYNVELSNNFEKDIQCIFNELCERFDINEEITKLFAMLLENFNTIKK